MYHCTTKKQDLEGVFAIFTEHFHVYKRKGLIFARIDKMTVLGKKHCTKCDKNAAFVQEKSIPSEKETIPENRKNRWKTDII